MGHKILRKSTVKKIAENEFGFTEVFIYYNKSEGWWLESKEADNWISIDSGGVRDGLKRLLEDYKERKKSIEYFKNYRESKK